MVILAPGRICLFGEHQDYFGLSIIAMAINREFTIESKPIPKHELIIHRPDIGKEDKIPLQPNIPYVEERDYVRAGINIFFRQGYPIKNGYEFTFKSTIPFQAGCSSSSAMCVAWAKTLAEITNHPKKNDTKWIAHRAFEMEVLEFKEAGGMMDHYTSSFGNIIYINFEKKDPKFDLLDIPLTGFVLGDTLAKKETLQTLKTNKKLVFEACDLLQKKIKNFSIQKTSLEEVNPHLKNINKEEVRRLKATLINRDICKLAYGLLKKNKWSPKSIGEMFNEQHKAIRDLLKLSTEKIESMIEASLKAGALGCKVNGSGGGGTFIAYAPGCEEKVIEAILKLGGQAFRVSQAIGVHRKDLSP